MVRRFQIPNRPTTARTAVEAMRELPWMARRIGATIIVKSDGDSTTDIFQDAWAACIDEALRS